MEQAFHSVGYSRDWAVASQFGDKDGKAECIENGWLSEICGDVWERLSHFTNLTLSQKPEKECNLPCLKCREGRILPGVSAETQLPT